MKKIAVAICLTMLVGALSLTGCIDVFASGKTGTVHWMVPDCRTTESWVLSSGGEYFTLVYNGQVISDPSTYVEGETITAEGTPAIVTVSGCEQKQFMLKSAPVSGG